MPFQGTSLAIPSLCPIIQLLAREIHTFSARPQPSGISAALENLAVGGPVFRPVAPSTLTTNAFRRQLCAQFPLKPVDSLPCDCGIPCCPMNVTFGTVQSTGCDHRFLFHQSVPNLSAQPATKLRSRNIWRDPDTNHTRPNPFRQACHSPPATHRWHQAIILAWAGHNPDDAAPSHLEAIAYGP